MIPNKAKHVVVMRRDDKTRVRLTVTLEVTWRGEILWNSTVATCGYRKKNWENVITWDYARQRLKPETRDAHDLNTILNHVTALEIHDAKEALWYQLRPVLS